MRQFDPSRLSMSFTDLFGAVAGVKKEGLARLILEWSVFIAPDIVSDRNVVYPNAARTSRDVYKGKHKGDTAIYQPLKREVTLYDNTKARRAFEWYLGLEMNGRDREVSVGWEVAHIWGRVFDPEYFTAGWNMVLMPGFLRLFTEEQASMPEVSAYLRWAAYRLYFKTGKISQPSEVVQAESLSEIPQWLIDFVPGVAGRRRTQGAA